MSLLPSGTGPVSFASSNWNGDMGGHGVHSQEFQGVISASSSLQLDEGGFNLAVRADARSLHCSRPSTRDSTVTIRSLASSIRPSLHIGSSSWKGRKASGSTKWLSDPFSV